LIPLPRADSNLAACLPRAGTVLSCLLLLTFLPAGHCAQPLAQTELLKISNQPWIAVDIGKHRGVQCIVDTGASSAGVLSTKYAAGAKYIGTVRTATADRAVKMPEVEIDYVAIGGSKQTGVRFMLRDQSWFDEGDPMPCVLGMEFLGRYTIDLDGSKGVLRLYPRGTRLDEVFGGALPDGSRLAASIHNDALIEVDATVDGVRVKSAIDTGWSLATPNQNLLDMLGIRPGDSRIVNQTAHSSLSNREMTLQILEFQQVRIGSVVAEKVRASLGEGGMRVIRKEQEPYLHIGWDLLRQHRLLLDMAHRDIALIP